MGLHSGKYSVINGVPTSRLWTISDKTAQPKGVASNTRLGTLRRRGVNSWEGSYRAYGGQPAVMPGELFNFVGYGSPTNDVAGAAGLRYSGDAVVRSVAVTWDWRTGAIIGHTVQFVGSLELVQASGADPGDAVVPDAPETTGTKFQYSPGNTNTFVDIANLTQGTLTVTAAVHTFVNSSTYVNGRAWTGARGGPIDWTLSAGQEDEDRLTGIFAKDDVVELKLFVSSTAFWKLTHGIVGDFSGITINRETGEIMSRTLNVAMNGYYGSTLGSIILPDTTTWWPF